MPANSPPPEESIHISRSLMSTPKNLLSPSKVDSRFVSPHFRASPTTRHKEVQQVAPNIHPRHSSTPVSPHGWAPGTDEPKADGHKPMSNRKCAHVNSFVICLILALAIFILVAPDKEPSEVDWTKTWDFSSTPAVHKSLASIEAAEAKMGAAGTTQDEAPAHSPGVRIVAIGDIHGDYQQGLRALNLAGLLDDRGHWKAADTVLVQTGDLVDRGDDSVAVLALFERLKAEAIEAGGDVINLLGNHELMNLQGDFRYISRKELETIAADDKVSDSLKSSQHHLTSPRLRMSTTYTIGLQRWNEMFRPSQPLGRLIRGRRTAVLVGTGDCRTLFVHAGILPGVLAQQGIRRPAVGAKLLYSLNLAMSELLSDCDSDSCAVAPGVGAEAKLMADDSPVWYRGYAVGTERMVCDRVTAVLQTVSAKRMVVGHTIQEDMRINWRCGGLIHLIDVGISRAYLGGMAAWECTQEGGTKALYEDSAVAMPLADIGKGEGRGLKPLRRPVGPALSRAQA